ncbi:MAG TPA: glycosyltransferase family 61 protein [Pyrinomonadaceae bacterium]|nr:glycosyltransferase family 61 protein [Pyrinomonadaceae bacterium]
MRRELISPVYAETVARRKLPVNFDREHLALFEGELQRVIPESELLRFRDVLASPEGLLFEGTKILPESFAFPYHLDQWKRRTVLKFLTKNYVFRRRRRIDADALWITNYWSTGYFHWLADALTRLFAVRDRVNDLLLVLPGSYQDLEYVKSSLAVFGVHTVDFIDENEFVECRNLIMPSHTAPPGHYHAEAIRGVRNTVLAAYGDRISEGDRVYISRERAGKRRIVNEDEILPILSSFGFQTVRTEELSFEQQVRVCSRARYVVSNHGAGLTNMLFMRDGGSVLELRHHTDCINNCFFTLASALELNYFYQTCAPQNVKADPHEADLLVDAKQLEQNLRLLVQ